MHSAENLLQIRNLHGWYGDSHVLHGISFDVGRGEVVSLLGRNGAGKSTTLKAIMGILGKRTGSVRHRGEELIRDRSDKIARSGIAYCPEERGIFGSLSVDENLGLPPACGPNGISTADLYAMFPNLERRRNASGAHLSGGEQQMLAIARILRTGATLLLLDEPTEGLAPVIVTQIQNIIIDLKKRGMTIILVEQNSAFASRIADRNHIVENGRIVASYQQSEFAAQKATIQSYLSV